MAIGWVPPPDWRDQAWEHRDTVLCGIGRERPPVALPDELTLEHMTAQQLLAQLIAQALRRERELIASGALTGPLDLV